MATLSASDRIEIRNLMRPYVTQVMSAINQTTNQEAEVTKGPTTAKLPKVQPFSGQLKKLPSFKMKQTFDIMTILYEEVFFEIDLKVKSLLRTDDGSKPSNEQIDNAFRLIGNALRIAQSPSMDISEPVKAEDTLKKFSKLTERPGGAAFFAKILTMSYEIRARAGRSDGLNKLMEAMEETTGKPPVELLNRITQSPEYDPVSDSELSEYLTTHMDACYAADSGRTSDVAKVIIDGTTDNSDCMEQTTKLIKAVSAKIPSLFLSDSNKGAELMGSILDFVEFMPPIGNDHSSNHAIYRLPIILNAVPTVEGSHFLAAKMFDLVLPVGQVIDSESRQACISQLPIFNMRAITIATSLFDRIANQELDNVERDALQASGVNIFSRNASQSPEQALDVWKGLLALQQGKRERLVALLDEALPAAQAVFPKNADFAKSVLSSIDATTGGLTRLQFGIVGSDLLAVQKPFGFIVMDANNQVAVTGGDVDTVGPAHAALAHALAIHRNNLTEAVPIVQFVTEAQDLLKRIPPPTGQSPLKPFKTVVTEAIRSAL